MFFYLLEIKQVLNSYIILKTFYSDLLEKFTNIIKTNYEIYLFLIIPNLRLYLLTSLILVEQVHLILPLSLFIFTEFRK